MVQVIERTPSIAGQLGKGVGAGLVEGLPKAVDRYRLSQDLKSLNEQKDLSPIEYATGLASIPNVPPALLQSLPELYKQQYSRVQRTDESTGKKSKVQVAEDAYGKKDKPETEPGKPKDTITTAGPVNATLNPYIPKSMPDMRQSAVDRMNLYPGLHQNFQGYLDEEIAEDQQNQNIQSSLEAKRAKQQDVQNRINTDIDTQLGILRTNVPGDVLSEAQDKAYDLVSNKGYTEKQAAKEIGKDLLDVSKDYQSLSTLGDMRIISKSSSANKESIKSLQKKFKNRGDLENFADSIISNQKLTAPKAYYLAYPVADSKNLNNTILSLKKLPNDWDFTTNPIPDDEIAAKTIEATEKIMDNFGKDDSLLSVATEIQSRNYDPRVFLNHVDKNRKKYDLSARQERELDKPRDFVPSINDLWMFLWSGLDPLVEIK